MNNLPKEQIHKNNSYSGANNMIEEKAKVVSIGQGYAMVKNLTEEKCSSCRSKTGCSPLNFFKSSREHLFRVQNPVYAQPGETVIIGIQSGNLLKSAFFVYLMPLIALIVFASVGQYLFQGLALNAELGSILFGLIGLMASIYFTKALSDATYEKTGMSPPVILRRVQDDMKTIHFAQTI